MKPSLLARFKAWRTGGRLIWITAGSPTWVECHVAYQTPWGDWYFSRKTLLGVAHWRLSEDGTWLTKHDRWKCIEEGNK